ncbi:MAG TPA: DUF4350 domain-containing protein [Planctomycetes bacterium]|nr:DUF4350 domain-containing protein [Fuerstiella sp.]HIK92843.1 DUF4350 domain-containing protein [Planctomycetota bacterium]
MKKKRRLQKSDVFWLTAVALLILLQFWWVPGDPGSPDDTYSNSIEGKRGFFQTLEDLAAADLFPPVRRESLQLIPKNPCTLVILSPDRYPNEYEQSDLADFVQNGGTLLFAPNWASPDCSIPRLSIQTESCDFDDNISVASPVAPAQPAASPEGGSEAVDSDSAELMAEAPEAPAVQTSATVPDDRDESDRSANEILEEVFKQNPESLPQPNPNPQVSELADTNDLRNVGKFLTSSQLVKGSVPWQTRATMDTGSAEPVVLVEALHENVQAAAWPFGNGLVVVSASADVFSNRAMLDDAQAELAVRLVEYAHAHHAVQIGSAATPVVICEFLNASDAYRGTAVLMSPTLRSGTLQLITIAILAGWFGFHRFGPAKRINTSQRRSLTESAMAVGNLHFRTSSGGEAVHCYIEYMKTQLQKMFGSSLRLDDTKVIALRAGLEPDEVEKRIVNAFRLDGASAATASQAASAIRDLSELLDLMTGNRKKT